MEFKSFLQHISLCASKELGGLDSQFKMAPELRRKYSLNAIEEREPKSAAVLVLFFPDNHNNAHFLLTERAAYKGVHSSQISFPGGKKEKLDHDLKYTALRETQEETGVLLKDISIVRELSKTYIPPSNFWVSPFIGILEYPPNFILNNEVKTAIQVSFEDLMDLQNLTTQKLSTSYMTDLEVPCFKFDKSIVWGATAMILSEVKDLLKAS